MHNNLEIRFVVCHIHKTSARLRFLGFHNESLSSGAKGHVCKPKPLPALVTILQPPQTTLTIHPSAELRKLQQQIQLQDRNLTVVPGFRVWVEAPRRTIVLYLAADDSPEPFDPPANGYWLELPESWHLSPLERDLLRAAYEALLH